MVRSLITGFAAALALAAAVSAADAQTVRHHHMRYAAVSIRATSSFTPALISTLARAPRWAKLALAIATSPIPRRLRSARLGPMFGNRAFDTLPSCFNPPGRPEPLFEF